MRELPCPDGWSMVKLGDLGEVNRGRSRHRPRYAEHLYGGSYPFIQTGDIRLSNGRITSHTQTYSEAGLAQSRLWPTGTMCITIAANIAETAVLTYPACFPDSVVGFIADPSKANVYFIEYMFRRLKSEIQHQASGSVQDNINLATLDRLRFPLPSLQEQHAIANVLCGFDDKIQQNRQTARALERLVQALYRAWFVDFEPVKVKLAGGTSFPSMPQAAFDALPARFVESGIGHVPEGWEIKPLSSVCRLVSGGTPKRSEPAYWGGDVPWYSIKDAPGDGEVWVQTTGERITREGVASSAATIVPKGSTIISARGTVGKLAMAGASMAFNQSCYGLLPIDGTSFCHLYLSMQAAVADLQQRTHGSVFDTITRSTFDGLMVVSPPNDIVSSFESVVSPLFDLLQGVLRESLKLAELRDYLLPRLVSGSVRVEAVNG